MEPEGGDVLQELGKVMHEGCSEAQGEERVAHDVTSYEEEASSEPLELGSSAQKTGSGDVGIVRAKRVP